MNNTPKKGITGDITNNSGWVTVNEAQNILNDQVFIRQAAIASYGCDVDVSARQALDHAIELLSIIKEHEQKGQQ